jgi:hypothetical protein
MSQQPVCPAWLLFGAAPGFASSMWLHATVTEATSLAHSRCCILPCCGSPLLLLFVKQQASGPQLPFRCTSSAPHAVPSSSTLSSRSRPPPAWPAVLQTLRIDQSGKTRRVYVKRRDLIRAHGLQPRDLRRVDPSLSPTKQSPNVTIKDECLLINIGGVRCAGVLQVMPVWECRHGV